MDISQIPTTWRSLLAIVSREAHGAVIAGGSLRDIDNGRSVKDIDIFVSGHGVDDLERLRVRLNEIGFAAEPLDREKIYPVGEGNEVVGVIDATHPDVALPIQVIMLDLEKVRATEAPWTVPGLAEHVMRRMDYGICQIVFDGSTVTKGADYERDRLSEVFAMRHERHGVELSSSVHRYARLSQKYVGWRWQPFDQFAGGISSAQDVFA